MDNLSTSRTYDRLALNPTVIIFCQVLTIQPANPKQNHRCQMPIQCCIWSTDVITRLNYFNYLPIFGTLHTNGLMEAEEEEEEEEEILF